MIAFIFITTKLRNWMARLRKWKKAFRNSI